MNKIEFECSPKSTSMEKIYHTTSDSFLPFDRIEQSNKGRLVISKSGEIFHINDVLIVSFKRHIHLFMRDSIAREKGELPLNQEEREEYRLTSRAFVNETNILFNSIIFSHYKGDNKFFAVKYWLEEAGWIKYPEENISNYRFRSISFNILAILSNTITTIIFLNNNGNISTNGQIIAHSIIYFFFKSPFYLSGPIILFYRLYLGRFYIPAKNGTAKSTIRTIIIFIYFGYFVMFFSAEIYAQIAFHYFENYPFGIGGILGYAVVFVLWYLIYLVFKKYFWVFRR